VTVPEVTSSDGNLLAYLPAVQAAWLATEPSRIWSQLDGSLVFADVSGFTPLTERLARRGKIGAEDLTDALNNVFCELLAVASRLGGDCLKFGGDALLLLFRGDAHVPRAAAAAHGMLAALKPFRRLRTEAGTARLDMSIGVHTGTIHLFLAGYSHRELIAAGPAVTRVLEMETAAAAGQILLSPEAAAHLEDLELGEPIGPGHLLARPPWVPTTLPDTLAEPASAARRGIPTSLIDHLAVGRQEGEHRMATIGFVQFGHSDRLISEAGPEALAGALDSLVGHIQTVCLDHDITFLATDADKGAGKVILATGTPVASTDDADRLVRALHAIVEGPQILPVRAGANRGRIFSVDVGSSERRCFTVMGDAVNLTARIMGKAEWGSLLVTDELANRVQTTFKLSALEPFMVKGKSEPVQAHKVEGLHGVRDSEGEGDLPLIGRQTEMALLRSVIADAHEGRGRVVELIAEAGMGKSRLVREVVGLPHELPVVTFEAGKYSRGSPYFALQRALRRLVGAPPDGTSEDVEGALRRSVEWMAPNLRPWIPLLGVPLGLDLEETRETARLDPAHRRTMLQNVELRLLDALLAGPTLVIIQDAHWLDDASSELLRQLAETIDRRPWAIIITRRDVPEGMRLDELPLVARIELKGLPEGAAASLASAVAGDESLRAYLLDELVERSGGNPLFLQELVAAATAGTLTELPDSVEAVMAASIDTLGAQDRLLLRRAAVLGAQFQPVDLAGLIQTSVREVDESLSRLDHFLFRDEAGTVRFRHGLIRDVAYEGLPFRSRRDLHRRAAEFIKALAGDHPEAKAEILSLHAHNARYYDDSWRFSRIAGERAQRNAAPIEAAAFYSRALEAGRQLPTVKPIDLAAVAESLADVCELGGRYDEASAAYRQARRLAVNDRLRLADLYRKEGWLREREGRISQSLRYYRSAFAQLDRSPPGVDSERLRAGVTAAYGALRLRAGRHRQAIPLLEEASRQAEATGARMVMADAYRLLDWANIELGTFHRAEHRQRALEIYDELGHEVGRSKVLNNMGIAEYYQGRWQESVAYYEQSSEAAARAGDVVFRAMLLNNIAEIRSDQGHLDEAERLFRDAMAIWKGSGNQIYMGLANSNLGRLASRRGHLDEGSKHLCEARAIFVSIGASSMLLEVDAREVERLVFGVDPPSALALAADLRQRTERFRGMPYVLAMLDRLNGYALCQEGDLDAGWSRLEISLDRARTAKVDYEIALTLKAMTRIGPLIGASNLEPISIEMQQIFSRLGVISTPEVPLSPS
jgi:class 3 adenylate cyclase/tetratricopeptide (TPR) repeat protein